MEDFFAYKNEDGKPFSTRILWGLINGKDADIPINNQSFVDLAKVLFPGFGYTLGITVVLAFEKLVKPAILKQQPNVFVYASADLAVKLLGEEVILYPVRKSDGEEWQEWIEIVEPGFKYSEWRKQN